MLRMRTIVYSGSYICNFKPQKCSKCSENNVNVNINERPRQTGACVLFSGALPINEDPLVCLSIY